MTQSTQYLAAIGASAGGLQALSALLACLPDEIPFPILVVQHLSPDHPSLMGELLARQTSIPVRPARDGEKLHPNSIYFCPPNADLTISDNHIKLSTPSREHGPKPCIDVLFASLAHEMGDHAVGIILSGTGSDGSHGCRSLRAAGGITIAQQPASAQYDSMPQSVISLGAADLILSPEEIGQQLVGLINAPTVQTTLVAGDSPWDSVLAEIKRRYSLDFSAYKPATIKRQLQRRIQALRLQDFDDYMAWLKANPNELQALANSFLISVTAFFRDPESFATLATSFDELVQRKKPGEPIRVWVPGCATGEEAYSIAMLLDQALSGDFKRNPVKIFATDIDARATTYARAACYPAAALADVPADLAERYFSETSRGFVVDPAIQELVVFARQDLLTDPPFLKVDLISCRNVLIYLKQEIQESLLQVFHYSLLPRGQLLLGHAEMIPTGNTLFQAHGKHHLYQRDDLATSRPSRVNQFRSHLAQVEQAATRRVGLRDNGPRQRLHQQLLKSYAPPSVLLDEFNTVLEIVGDTQDFFALGEGSVVLDVMRIIRSDLRPELRALIHQIRSTSGLEVRGHPVFLEGQDTGVCLCVSRLDQAMQKVRFLRVSFEPVLRAGAGGESLPRLSGEPVDDLAQAELEIAQLQHELANSREHLQTVIRELDTSNEELLALNEELKAAGEELQASNEELATSNEELQSTNEELTTVNDELQVKTLALSDALSALENIQDSTAVAIVVVNHDMLVTRFNSAAVRTVGLTHNDIGRNFTALPVRLPVAEIYEPLKTVLQGGRHPAFNIVKGSVIHAVEIYPYLNRDKEISGAVVNVSDISDLKAKEFALSESNEIFEIFARNVGAVVWVQEPDFGRFIYLNNSFRSVYGLDPQMALRDERYLFKVMHRDDVDLLLQAQRQHSAEPWAVKTRIMHPRDGSMRWLLTRGYPVMEDGRQRYTAGITLDITDEIESQKDATDLFAGFDLMINAANDGVLGFDQSAHISFANTVACRLLGYSDGAMIGLAASDVLQGTELEILEKCVANNKRGRRVLSSVKIKMRTGQAIVSDMTISSEPLLRGGRASAVAVIAEPQASRTQSKQQHIATSVFMSTQDGVMVLDSETRIIAVNPAVCDILKIDQSDLLGTLPSVFPSHDPRSAFPRDVWESLDEMGYWSGELHPQRSDGEFIVLEAGISSLDRAYGSDDGRYMMVLTDITQRRIYEKTIHRQAHFDALTGLPNRALMLDRLNLELRHAERDGSGVTLMFIDLDHFKEVNDSLGHEAGDELLMKASRRVQDLVRSSDTLSRFGGDEFVLMMPKYQRSQAPEMMARSLLDALEEVFDIKGHKVFISASIGIAIYPQDGHDSSELMRHADAAMYRAKESGRHGFEFYQSQMNADAMKRITMESELREALEQQQLRVYFQPIVTARDASICSLEALVRWQHPEHGLLPPSQFIPYAEESALIEPITRFVLQQSCERIDAWRAEFGRTLLVAVNFSAVLFRGDFVERWLAEADNDLRGLIVEVTESLFVDDRDSQAVDNILRLREHGALIALDDFGTGFSSLSYVRRFPVDLIKIDRSFVAEAASDARDSALVEASVAMAHGIEALVVAEGVETEQQADKMRQLGADRLQGYLFAKPLPTHEVDEFIRYNLSTIDATQPCLLAERIDAGDGSAIA